MENVSDLFSFATAEQIALCTSSRATWWRWRRGKARPPRAVLALLSILVNGEIIQGGCAWDGWKFWRGTLYDPAGYAHTPGTIGAWWWINQELQSLRRAEALQQQSLPLGVVEHPGARRASALSEALTHRLKQARVGGFSPTGKGEK